MRQAWIGVEVYQFIVQDVHVFTDFEKAKAWFKEYTGIDYLYFGPERQGNPELPEDYDQTKIFEVQLPEGRMSEERSHGYS